MEAIFEIDVHPSHANARDSLVTHLKFAYKNGEVYWPKGLKNDRRLVHKLGRSF
jgi:hypothetical protein